jgi:hypothetical protein
MEGNVVFRKKEIDMFGKKRVELTNSEKVVAITIATGIISASVLATGKLAMVTGDAVCKTIAAAKAGAAVAVEKGRQVTEARKAAKAAKATKVSEEIMSFAE